MNQTQLLTSVPSRWWSEHVSKTTSQFVVSSGDIEENQLFHHISTVLGPRSTPQHAQPPKVPRSGTQIWQQPRHRSAIQLPVLIAGTLEVRSMGPVQLHGPGLQMRKC